MWKYMLKKIYLAKLLLRQSIHRNRNCSSCRGIRTVWLAYTASYLIIRNAGYWKLTKDKIREAEDEIFERLSKYAP